MLALDGFSLYLLRTIRALYLFRLKYHGDTCRGERLGMCPADEVAFVLHINDRIGPRLHGGLPELEVHRFDCRGRRESRACANTGSNWPNHPVEATWAADVDFDVIDFQFTFLLRAVG